MTRSLVRTLASAALLATLAAPSFGAATITIINMDGAGEGFNDPTVVAAVGGNPGTTLGQQRLNCFTQAAAIWGATLTSSVTIQVQAAFNPLTCTATSAVLGSAGPRFVEASHPSFEFQDYWYHEALACKQAGVDLTPFGDPGLPPGDSGADISAQFNSNLGNPGCLTGSGWYYGFDHNETTKIDLLAVLLHEFGHGLGFSTTTSGSTGNYLNGPPALPALWDRFLRDETTGLHWDENSAAQRVASAINTGNLTWDGEETSYGASSFLSAAPELLVPFAPGSFLGNGAAFGPAITAGGVTGEAVVVVDPTAPTGDGCETPFVNAAALVGRIAVIDRGLCNHTVKVKNAQNAGAIGVVEVNNAAGLFSPGGSDPTITIPTLAISQADGAALKTAISGGATSVTIRLSPTAIAGAHPSGRVRMYAPNPFATGSSVSHFDVSATPNLLMEPAISADLTSSLDLTVDLFQDIGWIAHTVSVPGSDLKSRVALASSPNPARGSLMMSFDLASDENVELTLYDVTGREVRALAKGAYPAGRHDVAWDGLDQRGHPAAPGVYLARLKGARTQATHHLVLID